MDLKQKLNILNTSFEKLKKKMVLKNESIGKIPERDEDNNTLYGLTISKCFPDKGFIPICHKWEIYGFSSEKINETTS